MSEKKLHHVTLIPGDGSGPEVIAAAKRIVEATSVPIEWDEMEAGAAMIEKYGTPLPDRVLDSIRRTGVALKGPITTPVGTGFRSVNVALRKTFDLYANVRPAKTLPGLAGRFENVDLVIVRENTEDLYAGIEHMVGEDAAESIKLITRKGCERIVRYAFEYAVREGRKKVTAVHKANIMKCTDGLFLDVARQIAKEYPQIAFDDSIVDAMCMRLVMHPEDYDVLVCPNLYGDIVSDLCAGLVGGLGLTPSANIGEAGAIFEPIHGSAPDIAGQHKINPTAAILSASLMLAHLGEAEAAASITRAVTSVIAAGKMLTQDMGGNASTEEFADAVIAAL
ncbi:MAG: isocitrate/isopropylmalate dehydrogenase family protein [Anaerotignum sp.]|jgi:isocitrate dehydrogenase (NAD+)|nr:isocitrate/isopropylmalate dehydrogenase family protein [Anaerotignum sp.]